MILKIFSIILIYILSVLRVLAFMTIILLLFNEFYKIKEVSNILKIKKLSMSNYIAIAILVMFIIWPSIQEANLGNFGIKKLEKELTDVKSTIDNIFDRLVREHWSIEDFLQFNVEKIGEYYNYEINLKYKPVKNSVELWIGEDLMNPTHYTVKAEEKKIIFRHIGDMDYLKATLERVKPAITAQYIVKP